MVKKVFETTQEEVNMDTAVQAPAEVIPFVKVKQMVRWIGGEDDVFAVDREVSSYIDKGFRLLAAHYVGSRPETNSYGVLYILVHD